MKKSNVILVLAVLVLGTGWRLSAQDKSFTLPTLPYAYDALEPYIDAQTMEIHHSRHHNGYVNNLNKAVSGTPNAGTSLEALQLRAGAAGNAIRNNGGGHYNHSLFWDILGKDKPFDSQSAVGRAIVSQFGSLDSLQMLLSKAGATQFGSGWAWLYVMPNRQLGVTSTANQDNPLMDVATNRGIPILGIDVWEHAYYLKYQNKRGDYLGAIWNVINWQSVDRRYQEALRNPVLETLRP
ncbi:MAG: hypothetical protein RLY31_948 [Bacteroidota bacterium]|jgi:Fe-Mn family superoxide dismutase